VYNNTGTTHKFTGKERDIETGLDYFGARYYSNGRKREEKGTGGKGDILRACRSKTLLNEQSISYKERVLRK